MWRSQGGRQERPYAFVGEFFSAPSLGPASVQPFRLSHKKDAQTNSDHERVPHAERSNQTRTRAIFDNDNDEKSIHSSEPCVNPRELKTAANNNKQHITKRTTAASIASYSKSE